MFRWLALAVFLSAMGISTTHRARARRATGAIPRSREPWSLRAARALVALPLFGGLVAYLANPRWMDWASLPLPIWIRWLGIGVGVLVVPFIHVLLSALGSNVSETVLTKERHQLVTHGPYRWIRHPLYAAGLALFTSIGLAAANGFILLWTVVAAIGIQRVVIPREEAALVAAFGDDYRRYRAGTGALLPRLRRADGRRGSG